MTLVSHSLSRTNNLTTLSARLEVEDSSLRFCIIIENCFIISISKDGASRRTNGEGCGETAKKFRECAVTALLPRCTAVGRKGWCTKAVNLLEA